MVDAAGALKYKYGNIRSETVILSKLATDKLHVHFDIMHLLLVGVHIRRQ